MAEDFDSVRPVLFRRARSAESKAERERQILDAARRLGLEKGVRHVTLGDVARAVGLGKSNVLRYFETREAIYLDLSVTGFRDWAARVENAMRTHIGPVSPAALASVLADTLAADPLFCDVLGDINATLDHNVSAESARNHKHAAKATVDRIGTVIAGEDTGLTVGSGRQLVVSTVLIAASLWPATHPAEIMAELYRSDPKLAEFSVPFAPYLARQIALLIHGLRVEQSADPL